MIATTPTDCLLVEDDDDQAELIRILLNQCESNIRLRRASNGEEALKLLQIDAPEQSISNRPDLILLDLKLPRVSGHEVLKKIKSDSRLKSTLVIVLTSSDTKQDRQLAYDNHANSYLVKPSSYEDFLEMIKDLEAYWTRWNQQVPRET